ncbi:MAG: T9SS type A sorting domain-containing protein [Flavobacteriales bacterium]|nr:T9SS type A sorting domain-containing protein [Flavobacteriales bacterium]
MKRTRRLLLAMAASCAWLCYSPSAMAQGEDCSTATAITSLPATVFGNTSSANDDYNEVCPYTDTGGLDQVWSYSPVANETLDLSLCGPATDYDTKLYVYENVCGSSPIGCNDDNCSNLNTDFISEIFGLSVTAGNTYYIVVDGYDASSNGNYQLDITAAAPPSLGATCANPIVVSTFPFSTSNSTCGSINDYGTQCSTSYGGGEDLVFELQMPAGNFDIDLTATNGGSWIGWFLKDAADCAVASSCLANATSGGGTNANGSYTFAAGTYYLIIDTWPTPACSDFDLDIQAAAATPGEDCATAIGPVAVAVDELSCVNTLVTSGDFQDGPAASCSSGSGATPDDDVWISFVAPSNGNKVVITTTGISNTDWVMEVWDDCPGSGTPITCSDDVNGLMPEIELCQFQYTGGNTYYIRAWTWTSGGSGNTMDLCIYEDVACPTPPVNDNCGAATALTLGPDATWCPTNEIPGLTTAATPEGGNGSPSCDSFGTLNDVWYTIATGPTTAAMTVNVNDLSGTQEFAIYEALTCGSGGTVLSCLSTGTSSTVSVMPSSTYYVRVWANPGNEGDFTICAHEVCAPAIATTSPVDDCGNGQFFIDVDISSLGSSASVDIVTDFVGDTEPTGVGTGVTQIGPYPSGTTVIITLVHDNDPGCDAVLPAESYICPPPNDDCVNAIPVACNSVTAGTTTGATGSVEEDNGCGTSDGAPGVWYTVDGYSGLMQARLCGSSYDTKIRVFDGACGGLNCIDGNDDSCGLQSEVSWTGVGGTTYFIQVFGFSGFFGDEVGNFVLEVLCGDQNAPCPDNTAELELNTDDFGSQTSWEIIPVGVPTPVCSGSGYADNDQVFETCCLPDGCYRLRVLDSFGDGMSTGDYVLRDGNGNRIIDNTGGGAGFTSVSAIANSGAFCLPLGTDQVIYSHCDKMDFLLTDFLIASENPAVTAQFGVNNANSGYQFWLFDPNGSYSRRVFFSHANPMVGAPPGAMAAAHLRFGNLITNPVPVDQLLNARIRGRVNGVYNEFGPTCQIMVVSTLPSCPTTQLIDDPNNANFSCGVTRTFGGSDKVVAYPVAGANLYRFRFEQIGDAFVRNIASPSYSRLLNWVTNPLVPGASYNVFVQASFDGGANWCPYGDPCQVDIVSPPPASRLGADDQGSVTLWPNPNRGDQFQLTINELPEEALTVNVDIHDLFGKRVAARTYPAQGGMLNTVVDLDGQLATGMYLVSITAGDKLFTERLVIE